MEMSNQAKVLADALTALLDMVTDNRLHGPEVYAAANALVEYKNGGNEQ